MESLSERVTHVVEPAIEAEGYALVDVELKGEGGGRVLRLFIDKPDGSITLDDCQAVSELVNPILDVENVVEGRYYLEVSSPGINRRIKKQADFERFIGNKVKIHLLSPVNGRRKVTGVIEDVKDGEVIVQSGRSATEEPSRVPLAAIDRANLQVL
jgi:ribosome maturation factor RimP